MSEDTLQYKIKQGIFEGPLGLLLSLVEQKKLFINEISLAEVTNDYISYIKNLENIPKDKHISDISYFVLVAATLILIKSKSLLPSLQLTEDESEKIVDLETRLKIYKIIREASIDIKNNFGINIIFMPNERMWEIPVFSPDENITKDNMFNFASEVISRIPKEKEKLPEIEVKKVINIEEIIDSLTNRIKEAVNLSFKDFTRQSKIDSREEAKVHVIISFLAMLELVREGIIDVIQNSSFGDINISKQEVLS